MPEEELSSPQDSIASIKVGKSRFENLTGKFLPKRESFLEKRERKHGKDLELDYWTPERIELATSIMKAFSDELSDYGVAESNFYPDQFRVLDPDKTNLTGQHHAQSGRILLNRYSWENFGRPSTINNFAHEYAHSLSARILRNGRLRRGGLRLILNDRNAAKVSEKIPQPFKFIAKKITNAEGAGIGLDELDEAIVELTTHRVLDKYFPDRYAKGSVSYSGYIDIVDAICIGVSRSKPNEYKTPGDVFKLFEQAEFGRGRMSPLVRAIESAYGLGSFTKIMVALSKLPEDPDGRNYEDVKKDFEPLVSVLKRDSSSLDEFIASHPNKKSIY